METRPVSPGRKQKLAGFWLMVAGVLSSFTGVHGLMALGGLCLLVGFGVFVAGRFKD